MMCLLCFFFFSSRRRHTRCGRDWSSDVCSSDLNVNDVGYWEDNQYILLRKSTKEEWCSEKGMSLIKFEQQLELAHQKLNKVRDQRTHPGLDDKQRSEEHTSELQSRPHLVCRLLLEKK